MENEKQAKSWIQRCLIKCEDYIQNAFKYEPREIIQVLAKAEGEIL